LRRRRHTPPRDFCPAPDRARVILYHHDRLALGAEILDADRLLTRFAAHGYARVHALIVIAAKLARSAETPGAGRFRVNLMEAAVT